jgi:hypothetical protein
MKNTQKVQAMITEEEYIDIQRIYFWDGVNGKKFRGMSSWLRNLIQEEIARRPEEDKQSIRNIKR